MWILKKINNNCALARDDDGQDLVVFGKGIAYRRPPYELKDLSIVERTFYGVGGASVAALKDIPSDVLLLAADIVDYASAKLDTEFNPNAPVTLADHINFACQRVSQGVVIETPLSFDVMRLYRARSPSPAVRSRSQRAAWGLRFPRPRSPTLLCT